MRVVFCQIGHYLLGICGGSFVIRARAPRALHAHAGNCIDDTTSYNSSNSAVFHIDQSRDVGAATVTGIGISNFTEHANIFPAKCAEYIFDRFTFDDDA